MQIINGNTLVPENEWISWISGLRSDKIEDNMDMAVQKIAHAISNAVRIRIPKKRFGILFSGGVDSTLIAFLCKEFNADFMCYSVGIGESEDLKEARAAADELSLPLSAKEFSLDEAEKIIAETVRIMGSEESNIVNVGVGSVEVAAISLAKGVTCFYSGLGSEEIFAGYLRHEQSADINEECWNGLRSMWKRDLVRDYLISTSLNVRFKVPFLDEQLIKTGIHVQPDWKIKGDIKKYILRLAAERLGLPEKYAFRPKKAAQYGSNFDKAISKLAKKAGFKYKKDYIQSLSSEK